MDTPLWYITLFTISYFLSNILRIPDNGRNRNLEDFSLLLFSRNSRYHHCIVKPMEKIFKEFCKGFPTIVGQQRKVCFAELLKYLFHHSVNRFFKKHKHRKEKHLQSMANFFQENVATVQKVISTKGRKL